MESWIWWLLFAVVATLGELTVTGFFLLPFAIGAVAAAAVDLLVDGAALPWIVFAVVGIVTFLAMRPLARRYFHPPGDFRSGVDALVGHAATVTRVVDNERNQGAVKLDGSEVWTARAAEGLGPYDEGQRVRVVAIEGATAIVEAI